MGCKTYEAALQEMIDGVPSLSADPLPVVDKYDELSTAAFGMS